MTAGATWYVSQGRYRRLAAQRPTLAHCQLTESAGFKGETGGGGAGPSLSQHSPAAAASRHPCSLSIEIKISIFEFVVTRPFGPAPHILNNKPVAVYTGGLRPRARDDRWWLRAGV